jgi:uncharacterized protein (TIGR02265 family)
MSVLIGPRDVLEGDIGAAVRAVVLPANYVVKGMFFSRLKGRLEDCWEEVAPTLLEPPRFGHYVPFTDYPQRDYLTLAILIAERFYTEVGTREGLRRLARDDFGVFSGSTFGRIVLTAVGDVHKALLTMADVYGKMASGDWQVKGTEVDASTVALEWWPMYGSWEYQLGQIEGLVLHYGVDYRIEVSTPRESHFRFEIKHA